MRGTVAKRLRRQADLKWPNRKMLDWIIENHDLKQAYKAAKRGQKYESRYN